MTTDQAPVSPDTSAERAAALDAADPLAAHRDLFVGAESPLVYFDGNSLGRPLASTAERVARFVTEEWGGRLIRGWDERWMAMPERLGDRLGGAVLGAAPGQVVVGDSTTVLLYKLLRAGVDLVRRGAPDRDEVVVDTDNFPTDRYVVEGVAAELGLAVRWVEVDRRLGVTPELLAPVLGERTAVVLLSHVAYRSGHLADLPAITAQVHDAGGLVLWDLSHSGGSVPVDLDAHGADLAVGCTYKYLNGGPGAPAYAFVAQRHLDAGLVQPVQGWIGADDPFAMGPVYRPAPGVRRLLSGTPPVVGMLALEGVLDVLEPVGIEAVRTKSLALTSYAVDLVDAWLVPLGAELASPRDAHARGGHVTVDHPAMREVVAALWAADVLPDFRAPAGLRLGLSPLSTSFAEVRAGLAAVRDELARRV